jgi:hypothetical protein
VGHENIEPMPVIVGAPRSGTTMLRFMRDAHPDLAIPPETGYFQVAADPTRLASLSVDDFAEALIGFPEACPNWPDSGLDPKDFRAELRALPAFSPAEGFRTFYRMYARGRGKSRYGDKAPYHAFFIDHIERVLPEVRFVHIIRDGRDVGCSWRKTWFAESDDMGELAFEWMRYVLAARRQGRKVRAYLEIGYEELVRNPEPVLRRVCEFLDLRFDEAMLRSHEAAAKRLAVEHGTREWADGSRTVTAEERFRNQALTTQAPDASRIGVWRAELSDAEQHAFVRVAGATLRRLGYGSCRVGEI